MLSTDIKSYAKINWVLEILNKREDSYHNISSIFDLLNFYDDIKLKFIENYFWDVKIKSNIKELEKQNIIFDLFDRINKSRSDKKYLVEIELNKRIPLGGGLGGGSSNAATILYLFYKQKIIDIPQAFKIAKSLGSDVLPILLLYFYQNNYVLAFEKGNYCLPLIKLNSIPNFYTFLIVFPFKIDTKEAYKEYYPFLRRKNFLIGNKTYRFFYYSKSNYFREYFFHIIHNDFEKVIYKVYSEIGYVRNEIYEIFPKTKVFLCGSGASLLVISKEKIKLNFLSNRNIKVFEV